MIFEKLKITESKVDKKIPVGIHTGNQPEGVQVIETVPVGKAILDAVEAWRLAWSTQNIPGYFAAYADSFTPFYHGKRWTLDLWKTYKEQVISEKAHIHITLSNLSIAMFDHGNRARARFQQTFDSNNYHSQDNKELIFIQQSNGWKIVQEKVL